MSRRHGYPLCRGERDQRKIEWPEAYMKSPVSLMYKKRCRAATLSAKRGKRYSPEKRAKGAIDGGSMRTVPVPGKRRSAPFWPFCGEVSHIRAQKCLGLNAGAVVTFSTTKIPLRSRCFLPARRIWHFCQVLVHLRRSIGTKRSCGIAPLRFPIYP